MLSLSDILNIKISRFINVAANGIISFFLWLNNIPVCLSPCLCMCGHVCVYVIYTPHIFIHAPVDDIYVLAIVNSAPINTGVYVTLQIKVSSRYAQEWDCWVI